MNTAVRMCSVRAFVWGRHALSWSGSMRCCSSGAHVSASVPFQLIFIQLESYWIQWGFGDKTTEFTLRISVSKCTGTKRSNSPWGSRWVSPRGWGTPPDFVRLSPTAGRSPGSRRTRETGLDWFPVRSASAAHAWCPTRCLRKRTKVFCRAVTSIRSQQLLHKMNSSQFSWLVFTFVAPRCQDRVWRM